MSSSTSEQQVTIAGEGAAGGQLTNISIPLASIEKGLEIDVHGLILSKNHDSLSNLPAGNSTVIAVNNNPTSNRSEIRAALQEVAGSGASDVTLTVSTVPKPAKKEKHVTLSTEALSKVPDSSSKKNRDEFDLESSEGDEDNTENIMTKLHRRRKGKDGKEEEDKEEPETDPDRLMCEAAQRIEPGNCIIILTQGLNPAMYVEAAAKDNGVSVMYISGGERLRTKVRLDDFESILAKGLRSPVWILIESATKSISSLTTLVNAIKEVRDQKAFHPKTRIFLLCEPHPHFPEELLKGSVTLRFRPNVQGTNINQLEETMHDSRSRIDVLQGLKGASKGHDNLAISFKKERRRVQIAADVDVVTLETSMQQGQVTEDIPKGRDLDTKKTGLRLESQHTACRGGESLISLARMTEGRFAVGNNAGQILMLDLNALPMMQFRPLKACIWDMSFASNYDFAAACEDGSASVLEYDIRRREITTKASAKFESDVFAIVFAGDNADSAVVSGGLSNSICVLHSDRQQATRCPTNTSIQAMTKTHNGHILFGGGSGLTGIVDPETTTIVRSANKHTKKVPAASCVPNMALTGSFDKAVRLWDLRDRFSSTHSLVMADVVTAVCIDGNEMCCCSGNSLYLWDIRNLKTVLDSRVNAWKGLTRGLQIFAETKQIATASVDGVVRVWRYS